MRHNYTKKEDERIMEVMCEHPNSQTRALYLLSMELNRYPSSIYNRFKNHLDNPESKHYMGSTYLAIARRCANLDKRILESKKL
jgi:hypothetical protein